jgi:CyaY protein
MLDEQSFRVYCERAMSDLHRALVAAADDYGFEPDQNAGALTVEFEDPPAKFVVSPNAPVRQIWVSAQSKSFKLDWDPAASAFVYPATGESLKQLLAGRISDLAGQKVVL